MFTDAYIMAYASSDSLTDPYSKNAVPWQASDSGRGLAVGPGGGSLVTLAGGDLWMVYHRCNNMH